MSVHLAPPVATWVGVVLLAAGVAAIAVAVRRTRALHIGRPARPLVVLRSTAVLLLLFAFVNPTVVRAVPLDRRPRVRILLDASASMSVPDGRHGTRSADASAVWREVAASLGERFAIDTFAIGGGAEGAAGVRIDGPDRLTATGTSTDLGGALAVAAQGEVEAPVAIVLVSDGIDTVAGPDPRPPCPVLAVPVGTDLELVDDARVVAVRAPERADLHTSAAVEVEVAVTGAGAFRARNQTPSVTLVRGRETLGTKSAPLDASGHGVARFDVPLDESGVHALVAHVGPVPGDRVPGDDVRRAFVLAEDPSLRVLVLAARVTRELRPLRAEIARMPGVRVASVLVLAPGKVLTDGVPAGDPLASGFPSSPSDLSRFDVVVWIATPARDLSAAQESALVAFVGGGGGLFVVGDEDALGAGGWSGRALARVMPVEIRAADDRVVTGTFRAAVTPDGRTSPVLLGLLDAIAASEGGPGLVLPSLHRTGPLRAGAQALLETRVDDGPPRPLLVVGGAARGRALLWLSNTLHRAQAVVPATYAALVRQGIRWLASRSEERETLALATDRERYPRGATARVTALARGSDRTPRADAVLTARRLRLDGTEAGDVAFRPVEGTPGSFAAAVALDGDEPLRVRVSAAVAGAPPAVREVLLRTRGDVREGEDAVADLARLSALASKSGGAVIPTSALDEIPARLAATLPGAPRASETSLAFDSPWWLVAWVGCLAAEWILRRRQNLP